MKRYIIAAAGFAALTASASAADMAARPMYAKAAPAVVAPVFSWTGFYIGGQVGYTWRDDRNTERFLANGLPDGWSASSRPVGVVGGGHIGFNWQTGAFVLGIEADGEGSDVKGRGFYSLNGAAPITDSIFDRANWQASVRGRIGFAVTNWLLYATGGAAFGNFTHTYTTGATSLSATNTRTGWTVGAGVEYGFTQNWSTRLEYRYTDYGTITNTVPFFIGALQDQRLRDSTVRWGISYRFGAM